MVQSDTEIRHGKHKEPGADLIRQIILKEEKENMKRRLLAMLLCLVMCLSVLHVPAHAEDGADADTAVMAEEAAQEETKPEAEAAEEEDAKPEAEAAEEEADPEAEAAEEEVTDPEAEAAEEEAKPEAEAVEKEEADPSEAAQEEETELPAETEDEVPAEEASEAIEPAEEAAPAESRGAADAQDLVLNTEAAAVIDTADTSAWFRFVPAAAGEYIFLSKAKGEDLDTRAYLYNAEMQLIAENDDNSIDRNFQINVVLEAGEECFLETRFYNSGMTGSFTVMVTTEPEIASVTADGTTIQEYSNGYYEDAENGDVWFYYYCPEPSGITVRMPDGNTYSGTVYEARKALYDACGVVLGCDYYFSGGQSYEDQFTAGNSYNAVFLIGGKRAAYAVTIMADPIVSLEAEDTAVTEYSCGSWMTGDNGEEWFRYDPVEPSRITVETTDGNTYSGTYGEVWYQLDKAYGTSFDSTYYYVEDQNAGAQFTAGNSYEAELMLGGHTAVYRIAILSSPVAKVEAEDTAIYAESDGYWVEENGTRWFRYYSCEPAAVTVTATDGRSFTGNFWEVLEQMDEAYDVPISWDFYFAEDQTEHHFTAGNTYEAILTIDRKTAVYQVTIMDNPVASVSVSDVSVLEGTNGEYETTGNGEEWFRYYDIEPENIVVKMADGSSFSGSPWEVSEQIHDAYGIWFEYGEYFTAQQTFEDPFVAGNTYEAVFFFNGREAVYNVTIRENPIVSVEASNARIFEETNGRYEIAENGEPWFYYDSVWPDSITVEMNDGRSYSGEVNEVCDRLYDLYGEWFNCYTWFIEEQDYDRQFSVGNSYGAGLYFGGKTAFYEIAIEHEPLIEMEAENAAVLAGLNGYYVTADNGEEWFRYYETPPASVTIRTRDGKVWQGSVYTLQDELYEEYGLWYDYEYHYTEEQSYENQFSLGHAYGAELIFGELTAAYQVTVIDNPVVSVEAADITICEGSNGFYTEDGNGNEWFYYYCGYPDEITVRTIDGNTFSGDYGTVQNEMLEAYGALFDGYSYFTQEQNYANRFSAGHTYDAEFVYGDVRAAFTVTLTEDPIVSVEAEDVSILEGSNCYFETTDDGKEWICYYNIEPTAVTVTTKDGRKYTGDVNSVMEELHEKYGCWFYYSCRYAETQSYENQFSAGNSYEVRFAFGRAKTSYMMTIVKDGANAFALDKESIKIPVGSTETLKAVNASGSVIMVTWTSSDESIAEVDSSGKVTAKAVGICTITAAKAGVTDSCEVTVLFKDVAGSPNKEDPDYQYYYTPVYWAAENGITKGYSDGTFGVGLDCQRKDLMIFLWRYAGEPTADKDGNPYGDARKLFNDVSAYKPSSAANKAIAWAYKEGITKGYKDGGFHPTDPIVRKDVMILLYRLAGKPNVSGTLSFPDCQKYKKDSDTYKAILWGSKNKITNGYSSGEYAGQFGVDLNCLREQIVTFLQRYDKLKN